MSERPHPPALALHAEDAEALALALERLPGADNDDRTAGAAELLRLRTIRAARVAALARLAREAIYARRRRVKRCNRPKT